MTLPTWPAIHLVSSPFNFWGRAEHWRDGLTDDSGEDKDADQVTGDGKNVPEDDNRQDGHQKPKLLRFSRTNNRWVGREDAHVYGVPGKVDQYVLKKQETSLWTSPRTGFDKRRGGGGKKTKSKEEQSSSDKNLGYFARLFDDDSQREQKAINIFF